MNPLVDPDRVRLVMVRDATKELVQRDALVSDGRETSPCSTAQRLEQSARSRSLGLEEVEVTSYESGRGVVRFVQRYSSDAFADTVVKRLDVVREAGAWKIARETTVEDLSAGR